MAPEENNDGHGDDEYFDRFTFHGTLLLYCHRLQDQVLRLCPHTNRHLSELLVQLRSEQAPQKEAEETPTRAL